MFGLSWLPTALKIAPWAIAALAIAFGVVERLSYLTLKATDAAAIAQSEKALADFREQEATRNKTIADSYAKQIDDLRASYDDRRMAIANAPATANCATSPAIRSVIDGLRSDPDGAGKAQPSTGVNPGVPTRTYPAADVLNRRGNGSMD